jgi:hypothetical protein
MRDQPRELARAKGTVTALFEEEQIYEREYCTEFEEEQIYTSYTDSYTALMRSSK